MKEKTANESGLETKKRKKLALGRGLDALLPRIEPIETGLREYFQCDIELIRPNRFQPRMRFSSEELDALRQSIQEQGILQPLLVRKDDIGYEIAVGERRLRAAKLAGLRQVPVVIRDLTDAELLEMSLVENIQRENLNPMEEAEAFHRLMAEFNFTQEQVADRVGKSRSAVANFLRLRQLPEPVKASIMEGELSMGHARALLGAETSTRQMAVWRTVISKGLSVRETEALVKRIKKRPKASKKASPGSEDIYFSDLESNLSRYFGTRVKIIRKGQKGKVELEFYSSEDLDRLIGLLQQS